MQQVTYQFPKVVVTWTASEVAEGKGFTLDIYGSKGMMTLLRSGFQVTPEMIGPGQRQDARNGAPSGQGRRFGRAHTPATSWTA